MNPRLEETIYVDFITSASTGAATDADSTPTIEVFEDATDTAILTPTATKRTSKTGDYRVPIACTAANGFEDLKSYNVIASATVGGIAAKAVVARFQVRSTYPASGNWNTTTPPTAAAIAAAVWDYLSSAATTVGSLGKRIVDYLDAKVSDAVGSGTVTVYTSVNYTGSTPPEDSLPITLYRGCADTISPPSLTDYAGGIQDGDDVVLRIVAKDVYDDASEDDDVPALVESVATASLVDGTLTIEWPVTAEQMSSLPAGADGSGRTVYKAIGGKDGERPIFDRDCVVLRFPAAPV